LSAVSPACTSNFEQESPELFALLFRHRSRPAAREELLNDGNLARLFEQKTVVPVRRIDHMKLDILAE